MAKRCARIVLLALAVAVVLHARTTFAQQNEAAEVWSRSQDGRPVNKIGIVRDNGGSMRIWLSGTTTVLDVFTGQPSSVNGDVVTFTYFGWDTRGQTDEGLWRQKSAGELRVDVSTLVSGNYMDGAWKKTHEVDGDMFITRSFRKVTFPWYPVRFIVP